MSISLNAVVNIMFASERVIKNWGLKNLSIAKTSCDALRRMKSFSDFIRMQSVIILACRGVTFSHKHRHIPLTFR